MSADRLDIVDLKRRVERPSASKDDFGLGEIQWLIARVEELESRNPSPETVDRINLRLRKLGL